MEIQVKKQRALYQELINTINASFNRSSSQSNMKERGLSEILNDIDLVNDELENLIDYGIESKIKDLQHHKDVTIGLYAINFDPKELIKIFVNSQSDATRLFVDEVEELVEDWVRFIDNKNIGKSPFFKIS